MAAESKGSVTSSAANPQWADRVGICLSGVCMVHCLLTPVVLFFLPSLSVGWASSHLHDALGVLVPAFAFLAFVPGYRLHGDKRVLVFGLLGLMGIWLGILGHFDILGAYSEPIVTSSGSVAVIYAHILNRKLCACRNCQGHAPKFEPAAEAVEG